MRAVLDTDVVVSGVLTAGGTCARILDLVADGVLALAVNDHILAEYDRVLHRPELSIAPDDAAAVMELLRSVADPAAAVPLPVRLPDPDDAPFLEVAAATESILVTGTTRHFPKKARAGVVVLSPAELLELLRQSR